MVGMPGWGADFQGVHPARVRARALVLVLGERYGGPPRVFFGVVAGFAESCAVVQGGGAAFVPGDDVVNMPDGRVTVGGAAGVVPGFDEAS